MSRYLSFSNFLIGFSLLTIINGVILYSMSGSKGPQLKDASSRPLSSAPTQECPPELLGTARKPASLESQPDSMPSLSLDDSLKDVTADIGTIIELEKFRENTDVLTSISDRSRELDADRTERIETFYQGSEDTKVDTIRTLSLQGKGIDLLEDVLMNESSDTVKLEVVRRLASGEGFAVKQILLDNVASESEVVMQGALDGLVGLQDQSVRRYLEKMSSVEQNTNRQQALLRAIHQMEMNVTMGLDGLTMEP